MEPYAPYPLNLLRDWLHRRRWWIRLVLAIVLVPYLAHFAYTRWTTTPPRPQARWGQNPDWESGLHRPPPSVDRTADLVAAIKTLPKLLPVPVPTTAPAGHQWVDYRSWQLWKTDSARFRLMARSPTLAPGAAVDIDFLSALSGPWEPGRRLQVGAIVSYLEQPETRDALGRIDALSAEPFCVTSTSGLGTWPVGDLGRVINLMTTRVRYHAVQRNDFPAAARDARHLLELIANYEDDGTSHRVGCASRYRSRLLNTLMNVGRESALTIGETRGFIQWLEDHPYDARLAWLLDLEGELLAFDYLLDSLYTDDGTGNGWLALYRPDRQRRLRPTEGRILRCLNLLSPVFDDRRSADIIASRHFEEAAKASKLSYVPQRRRFSHLPLVPARPTVLPDVFWNVRYRGFAGTLTGQAEHGAAIASLALSTYKTEHGEYPETLAALVPRYMSKLPIDPFVDKPLGYRLDDRDGYILYSVGEDAEDNGGVLRDEQGEIVLPRVHQGHDLFFPSPHDLSGSARYMVRFPQDWILIPLDRTDGPKQE